MQDAQEEASQRGAVVYYENLTHYRDFVFRREPGRDSHDVSVGMWAKQFMSSSTYQYMGTVTTWKLYKAVVKGTLPTHAAETDKEARIAHNSKVLKDLKSLATGKFKDQFAHRLHDAIALCEHNWGHFAQSSGQIPTGRLQVPAELFLRMNQAGKRSRPGVATTETPAATLPAQVGDWLEAGLGSRPPPLKQRPHQLAIVNGLRRGPVVEMATAYGGAQPTSLAEFRERPIMVGGFVLTHSDPLNDRIKSHCLKATKMKFWAWKVLQVYSAGIGGPSATEGILKILRSNRASQVLLVAAWAGRPGQMLPPNLACIARRPTSVTYECHLYVPSEGHTISASTLRPVWDLQAESFFLSTPGERGRGRVGGDAGTAASLGERGSEIHIPLAALLRPENVLGGGFHLTSAQHVPPIVRDFINSIASRT